MMVVRNLKVNPLYAALLPPQSEPERDALKASIAAEGVKDPIKVDESGNILDGHSRFAIDPGAPTQVVKGLSEAEKVGKKRQNVQGYRAAAEVLIAVRENPSIDMQVFLGKSQHLAAIHKLPKGCWPGCVEAVGNQSAADVTKGVAKAKEFLAGFELKDPEWGKVFLGRYDCAAAVFAGTAPGLFARLEDAATIAATPSSLKTGHRHVGLPVRRVQFLSRRILGPVVRVRGRKCKNRAPADPQFSLLRRQGLPRVFTIAWIPLGFATLWPRVGPFQIRSIFGMSQETKTGPTS